MKVQSIILIAGLTLGACKSKEEVTVTQDGNDLPYRKVAKHDDHLVQFQYAEKYYANGDYFKAQTLYEEVIPKEVTTDIGRTSYYKYADCHYLSKDFYLAGYYFKQFHKKYNFDPRAEEALFKSALCKVRLSPEYSLDQTDTEKAIDQLQLFLDKYPDTEHTDTCNKIIDKLTLKLDRKKFEVAMLAYKTEQYKSATVLYDVCLEEFPQSVYKEQILFYKMKSYYNLAINSIEQKKMERFEETIKSYRTFVSAFPESLFIKDAENVRENATKKLGLLSKK